MGTAASVEAAGAAHQLRAPLISLVGPGRFPKGQSSLILTVAAPPASWLYRTLREAFSLRVKEALDKGVAPSAGAAPTGVGTCVFRTAGREKPAPGRGGATQKPKIATSEESQESGLTPLPGPCPWIQAGRRLCPCPYGHMERPPSHSAPATLAYSHGHCRLCCPLCVSRVLYLSTSPLQICFFVPNKL